MCGEYSKRYQEWLKLSDEEKENTIAPLPFNVREESDKGIINRIMSTFRFRSIPDRYDLRENIAIEIKNQMDTGECWAFSATSSVETNLALTTGEEVNYSERHVDYDTAINFIDGTNEDALNRMTGDGGYPTTAFSYYSKGSGPILEEDMPFENNEYTISINQLPKDSAVKQVEDMVYFPNIYKIRNENYDLVCVDSNGNEYTKQDVKDIRDSIKQHIMNYGALSTDILAPYYYYNEDTHAANVTDEYAYPNHAVTIIGWDDNYDKEKFLDIPSEDGAYIVLNSWGTEWGESGIYYISYEDCLVETQIRGVKTVSEIDYDNIYQHDKSEVCNYINSPYAANVFTATQDEVLTEIMIGATAKQICDVYVNATSDDLNINNLIKVASEVEIMPGYTTIKLDENINLSNGNNFSVVVKIIGEDYIGIGIEDNYMSLFANTISNQGESFISDDGINWTDIYDENNMMNFSIKAYTKKQEDKAEIIDMKYPNKLLFEGREAEVKLKLKTSLACAEKDISIAIYKDEIDVTDQFYIKDSKISSNLNNIKIIVPINVTAGEYKVKINCDSNVIAEEILLVSQESFDTDVYTKIKFNDTNLYKALKNNVLTEDKIFAYYDDTQELILRKDIEELDFEGTKSNYNNGYIKFGSGYNISDFTGIENLKNIKRLVLSGNPLNDLKFVETMTGLEDLQLYYGLLKWSGIEYNQKIKNIEVIGKLVNLKRLDITNAELEDISFLANLTKITTLDLQQNKISDISVLGELEELNYLCLDSNNIENIDVLEKLAKLGQLFLQENKIKDIKTIGKLKNLGELCITANFIEDATIIDEEECNTEKGLRFSLYMPDQRINKEISINSEEYTTVIDVPIIIQQACNEKSNLYSPEGINLINCQWQEFGKSIIINKDSGYATVQIMSGPAFNSIFQITVQEEIKEIRANINRTTYLIGEDLDLSVGGIKITYESGREEFIPWDAEGVTIEGYNKTQLGEQIITVTYEDKITQFTVQVTDVVTDIVTGMEITTLPYKTHYRVDETIDLTGGVLSVTYLDGTIEEISMTDENIEIRAIGLDDLEEWEPKVELTYKGVTIEFDIYRNTNIDFGDIDKILNNQLAIESIETIGINSEADLSKLNRLTLFSNLYSIWFSNVCLQDVSILNELNPNNDLSINIHGGSFDFTGINNQKITYMSLWDCEVSNLKEIENLKELNRLDIARINGYEELVYSEFENLESLYIREQKVQNYHELLTSLSELENMRVLSLTSTNLHDKDTEYLAQIKTLQELYIEDTYVTDISFLKDFKNLNCLALPYGVRDLSVIYELKSLYNLNVDGYTETNIDDNLINYLDEKYIWYTEFDKDISNKIEQIIEELEITDSMTDEEKVRKVTEYVVDYMNYGGEEAYANTILDGAVNNRAGTFNGYTMLEYVLLKKVGIEAYYVDGYIGNTWNIVKLNGKWYGIDVAQIDFHEEYDELSETGWEMYYLKNPISDGDANNYSFASSHKAYFNPYDDDRTLAGIEITELPKTEYILGEDLDFSDGIITLTYYNGDTEEIPMTSEGVNQPGIYDKTKTGWQTITIEYLGYTDTFDIYVSNNIEEYQWYLDGELVTTTAEIPSIIPDRTVTVPSIELIKGQEGTLELHAILENGDSIVGIDNILDNMNSDSEPTIDFYSGELMKIEDGKYEALNEGTEVIGIYDSWIDPGIITQLQVNVTNDVVGYKWYVDGEVVTSSDGIEIKEGKEAEVELYQVLQNGEEVCISDLPSANIIVRPDSFEIAEYNKDTKRCKGLKEGQTELILELGIGNEFYILPITVIGIEEITVKTVPTKSTYYLGEEINLAGGVITVKYKNGDTEELSMIDGNVGITGSTEQVGEQPITITYREHTATFTVNVIDNVIESEKYEVTVQNDTNYIENITENVSVEEFKKNIAVEGSIEVYKDNKKIEDDKIKLSTGMVLKVTLNNKTTDYNIVVTGDINGDGDTNQIDLLMLARYKAGFDKEKEMVQNAYLRATDIMKDNNLASDIDLLKFARVLAHLDEL